MTNLVLSPDEFAKEIRVVMEERRWRTDDRPRALVYEQLMATALDAYPYRRPIIGWMNDLENMHVDDVREFYQRWYAPNNAILVVVGDVTPQEVFDLAEQQFGGITRAGAAAAQAAAGTAAGGNQAPDGESAGRAAVRDDGLSRAGPARSA